MILVVPAPEQTTEGVIHESEWKKSINQECEFKHIWAFWRGKCFVAVATRTSPLRFVLLPLMRGTAMEFEHNAIAIQSDEEQARSKVVEWLSRQQKDVA